MKLLTLTLALASLAAAADLEPANHRQPAPRFTLRDASGKAVSLDKLRGKVVLLDFWATWCHGCKEEIPWFSAFQKTYGKKGLAVVGVSMDDGWDVVKSFLAQNRIPYRILLGDEQTSKQYGIVNMPDTFLIDRNGKLAASYTGMVDKDNVEANIRLLLAKH